MASTSSQQSSNHIPRASRAFTQLQQLQILLDYLMNKLGMSRSAAGTLANQWRMTRDDTKPGFASTILHTAIHFHINTYRAQSFANFLLEVNLYPARGASGLAALLPGFNSDGWLQIGYNKYTFQCGDISKDMLVRVHQGTVQINFCGRWRSISCFLDELEPATSMAPFDSKKAYDTQFEWYRSNGKSFNILHLPGELRNAIYEQVLGPVAIPHPKHKCRRGRTAPSTQTAIMRLNKQTHRESSHIFYSTSTMLLEHDALVKRVLHNRHLRTKLRDITLDLSHSGFLDLFRYDPIDIEPRGLVLRALRKVKLSRLEIHIRAPTRISRRVYIEGACQKTMVEHIFEAAMPSITGHPVVITGFIKDSQKAAISAHFDSAHEAFTKWSALTSAGNADATPTPTLKEYDDFLLNVANDNNGGVLVDSSAGPAEHAPALRPFVTSLSFVCFCARKCAAKGWTSQG
ncbi:hypothetical protein Q7P37_007564 [Cladosporium fusiforme]